MTLRKLEPTTWVWMSGWMMLFATLMLSILSVPASARNQPARKPSYTVLHKFTGGEDGGNSFAGLLRDAQGNLYGTTCGGGAFGWGVVFKLDSLGKETVLHSFAGGDGICPAGPLIQDSAGNFYGTTTQGGTPEGGSCRFGCGTVFKIDKAGKYTVLYAFTGGTDGGNPADSLIRDSYGNLYGITYQGGDPYCSYCGVVFKVDRHGKETVLHAFGIRTGDGQEPSGGLVRDATGNLYGATSYGGASNWGTVFELDSSGEETVLYNFTGGTDGGEPNGPLLRDEAGNLYGTASIGGDLSASCAWGLEGCGVVFKLDAHGNETILYTFTGGKDQGTPNGGLLRDPAGNFYGTTGQIEHGCGTRGCAIVFKLSTDGTLHVLHTFENSSGIEPFAGVIMDAAGNLYGTTLQGGSGCGTYGCGVAYKWAP